MKVGRSAAARPHSPATQWAGAINAAVRTLAVLLVLPVAVASAQPARSDLEIRVASVGPGGLSRAGSWIGVRVLVQEQAAGPREIVLRLATEDPDGDLAAMERVVTTTPGQQSFWLYSRLPLRPDDQLRITAHVSEEDGGVGRLLAETIEPIRPLPPWNGVIGVIGERDMELRQYSATTGGSRDNAPLAHTVTEVVTGLRVVDLPDRWQGLEAFGVLVWGASSGDHDPQNLVDTPDKADAIREWIERGGHLVVVLPSIGQNWSSAVSNPLVPLLPAVGRVRTLEGADLEPFRPLLAGDGLQPMPDGQTVRLFQPASEAGFGEAIPIIGAPSGFGGGAVVMRRLVGSGAVDLVGLDLTTESLRRLGLPEVETFWHRVLGRRGRFLSQEEIADDFGVRADAVGARRERRVLDLDINEAIERSGAAAQGLLLAIIVFGSYWVIAGPLGFAMLKARNWHRHAWVAFVGAVGVFTAVAWSGAFALRPKTVDATALAVVEQVHGQPLQRGRMWSTVLIPRYGDAVISTAGDPGSGPRIGGPRFHNLIAPWAPFDVAAGTGSFPDNRTYRLDTRRPDEAVVPVRSTVKQVRIDWAGAPRLSMPAPVGEVGDLDEADRALRVTPAGRLEGVLMHDLPRALDDSQIVWVTGQVPVTGDRGDQALAVVNGVTLARPDGWAPGERLDLGELTSETNLRNPSFGEALSDIAGAGLPVQALPGAGGRRSDLSTRLYQASFLLQATPPPAESSGAFGPRGGGADAAVGVMSMHGYDLSRWFTQPCVIVMGYLAADEQDDPLAPPVPLEVDGVAVPTRGRVLVRWIYPLPPEPPAIGREASSAPEGF